MRSRNRILARFMVSYVISGKPYWFTIPAQSAASIWASWDRPGVITEVVDAALRFGFGVQIIQGLI